MFKDDTFLLIENRERRSHLTKTVFVYFGVDFGGWGLILKILLDFFDLVLIVMILFF